MDIRLQIREPLRILSAHENIRIYILLIHIRRIVLLDPVQTVLRVVRTGHIHVIIFIQDGKRTSYCFRLSYLYRGRVA